MEHIPNHIVLYPDGNSRWSKQNNTSNLEGYQKGYQNLLDFCQWCKDRGVKTLTVFGFSTENWDRNQMVVDFLMKLFENKLVESLNKYNNTWADIGVRIRVIGQKERLPKKLQQAIKNMEEATKNNTKLSLNLAISYGGKWDILNAVKNIIKEGIEPDKITEKVFEDHLSTAGQPVPDFVIRTGGDKRLSNFALWQMAYSELYFCPKYWPAFTEQDLDEALADFAKRTRRFGK